MLPNNRSVPFRGFEIEGMNKWLIALARVAREAIPAIAGALVVELSREGVLPPGLADALGLLVRALFGS